MGEVTTRKETPTTLTQAPSRGRPPFDAARMMREMLGWDPFRDLGYIRTLTQENENFEPQFDVKETKDAYVIKADMPGVKDKDLDISIHSNRLQIAGSRASEQEEKGETYYACERTYGSFTRVFTLPDDADPEKIKADLSNGVLSVTLAKRPESKVKHVPVKAD